MSGTTALPSLTDPTMTSAQWAQVSAAYPAGGTQPAGVPSSQWGPFGLTPPPGSPAAKDYWTNLQYGGSPPAGAVPMDPSQYTEMYERMTANTSHYGGGMQIPVGVEGSPFNPTQGNPNFTINEAGYGVLTPQGQTNLNDYALQQLRDIYRNAAKNRSGISGFLGTPAGAIATLGFPLAVGGGVAALGGTGLGAGGAGATAAGTEAGTTAGDITLGATTAEPATAADVAGSAGGAAAGGTGTTTSGSGLFGFLSHPLSSLGLPSWTDTALKGVNLAQKVASLATSGSGGTTGGTGGTPMAINLTGNPYTGQLASLGGLQTGLGTAVSGVGLGQLLAGASGQLTPADQALVKSTLDQMNLGTSSRYANLGLGGSTMETMDRNANQLRSEAESAELAALEERLGLQALQGGESFLGGAGTNIGNASRDYQAAYNSLINTIAGLGNKSAGGGLSGVGGGLTGLVNSIFGKSNPDMNVDPFAGNTMDTAADASG